MEVHSKEWSLRKAQPGQVLNENINNNDKKQNHQD